MRPAPSVWRALLIGSLLATVAVAGLIASGLLPALVVLAPTFAAAYVGWKVIQAEKGAEEQSILAAERQALAEREAVSQRRAIDAFADGLEVAIIICDARATIQYANRRAVEIFGGVEPIGRSLLAATLSPDLEAIVRSAGRTGTPIESELAFGAPAERVALAKAWRPDDAPGRIFLSLIEITDLRRLERIRKDFVANVSHELRTPLTIIRAYAETLQDDDDEDLRHRYLAKIVEEVDRLTAMSQDLLVLTTSESNPIRKAPCDLASLVRGVVTQLVPRAAQKGLTIVYEGPATLMVEANEAQMTQVALNLVENAVKYSPVGEVDVCLSVAGADTVLEVRDRGIGIASEHVARIFERFYRVDRGRSRAQGGTGLGLAIVRHIIEAHGGRVEVESTLNVGTTFRVHLPTGKPAATTEAR